MHFLAKSPEVHFHMMQAPWLLPVATLHVAAFHIQTRWRVRRLLRASRGAPMAQSPSGEALPPSASSDTLSLPLERRAEPLHVVYERYVQRIKARRRQLAAELAQRGRLFGGVYGDSLWDVAQQAARDAHAEQQVNNIRTPGHVEHDSELGSRAKWILRELPVLHSLEEYATTRISAWWRSIHNKWWFWLRFLRPRRVVYQVAALELQQVLSAWMRRRRGARWQAAWRNQRWLHYRDMGYTRNPTRRQEMQLPSHRRFRPLWTVWDYRAWQIQCLWRNFRDKRVAGFLARLVTRFNASGDTRAVLAGVAAGEAALADAASKLIVRFRLGGGANVWPPVLLYRVGTAAPVCDVGAFAPRDYAAVQKKRAALSAQAATLKQLRNLNPRQFRAELGEAVDAALDTPLDPEAVDDTTLSSAEGWYQRDTRNNWRMVSLGKVLSSKKAAQFMPDMPVPVSVSSAAGMTNSEPPDPAALSKAFLAKRKKDIPWHHDPAQRRRNRAAAHVSAKGRWINKMKALYMNQLQPSPSEVRMVPDDAEEEGYYGGEGGVETKADAGASASVRFQSAPPGNSGLHSAAQIRAAERGGAADEDDDDDEALLEWMGAIDLDAYDQYVSQWHALGTTEPSAPAAEPLDATGSSGDLRQGSLGASRDFRRLSTTVSGPQPPPRHAPLQPSTAAAEALQEENAAALSASAAAHEEELAKLGIHLRGVTPQGGGEGGGQQQPFMTSLPPTGMPDAWRVPQPPASKQRELARSGSPAPPHGQPRGGSPVTAGRRAGMPRPGSRGAAMREWTAPTPEHSTIGGATNTDTVLAAADLLGGSSAVHARVQVPAGMMPRGGAPGSFKLPHLAGSGHVVSQG